MRASASRRTLGLRIPALAITCLQACASWQPVTAPLPEFVRDHPTTRIRVTTAQGQSLISTRSSVSGDSLHGELPGFEFAVALADVTGAQVRRTNVVETVVLVGVVGGLVIGLSVAASNAAPSW